MANIDQLPCYYFAINDNAEIAECNDILAFDLQFNKSDLIGKSVEKIFPVATRIFFQTHLAPLLKLQGSATEIFINLVSSDKKNLSVLCNAKNILRGEESLTAFVSIRVENRNKFEQGLIEAKTLAEKALNENSELKTSRADLQKNLKELDSTISKLNQQNEELRQLHHIMSHELQEPLRKISIFSDLIVKENGEKLKDSPAKKLAKASSRLRSVIDGLQNYVNLSSHQQRLERINLNHVVTITTEELKKKYLDVAISVTSDVIPELIGYNEQVKQLFFHILDNCIHFRKPNINPVVEITSSIINQNRFENIHDKYEYQKHLRIRITDNGTGFNSSNNLFAFDLFKKLHGTNSGGTGLAFSRKIMENHGGKILLESVKGTGTTVILIFPAEAIAV